MTQNKAVINYLPNRIYRIYRIARKGAILPVGGAMLPDGYIMSIVGLLLKIFRVCAIVPSQIFVNIVNYHATNWITCPDLQRIQQNCSSNFSRRITHRARYLSKHARHSVC